MEKKSYRTLTINDILCYFNLYVAGWDATPMFLSCIDTETMDAIVKKIPFPKRLGQPEETAALISHIISNKYINGTMIINDGGFTTS